MASLRTVLRRQLPIYGAGVFSNSNVTILSIIVPLPGDGFPILRRFALIGRGRGNAA